METVRNFTHQHGIDLAVGAVGLLVGGRAVRGEVLPDLGEDRLEVTLRTRQLEKVVLQRHADKLRTRQLLRRHMEPANVTPFLHKNLTSKLTFLISLSLEDDRVPALHDLHGPGADELPSELVEFSEKRGEEGHELHLLLALRPVRHDVGVRLEAERRDRGVGAPCHLRGVEEHMD